MNSMMTSHGLKKMLRELLTKKTMTLIFLIRLIKTTDVEIFNT